MGRRSSKRLRSSQRGGLHRPDAESHRWSALPWTHLTTRKGSLQAKSDPEFVDFSGLGIVLNGLSDSTENGSGSEDQKTSV